MKINKFLLAFLWLNLSFSLFAGSVYDEYQNGPEFSKFDTLMNQVRFPTSTPQKMKQWVGALELAKVEFPNYPELPQALYFLGHYNLELKNHRASLVYLKEAKQARPELSRTTPLDRYIEECEQYISYRLSILISSAILLGWSALIVALLLLRLKRKDIKPSRPMLWGFCLGSAMVFLVFLFSSAGWSDGMVDFYCPPTLVKSSLLSPGSGPLWKLLLVSIFSCAVVALSALVVKKHVFIFAFLTALLIGTSSAVLYYQIICHDVSDRTGINLPKRVTFKETIIEWHKDVPDEMLPMYDKKLQLLIQDAKEEAAKEEINP